MRALVISKETFAGMLPAIIETGVTFEAKENNSGDIRVVFTGGY